MVLEKLDSHMQKKKNIVIFILHHIHTHTHTPQSGWNTWRLRPETIKLLEENTGIMLLTSTLANIFKIWHKKLKQQKEKQTSGTKTKFCTDGLRQQNERATYQVGENICKQFIYKRLISKMYA